MIHNVTDWLIASGYIDCEDKEIIKYGLEQGLYSLLGIFIALVIGYMLNVLAESIIFIIFLIPLRMYTGGYHANTRRKCICISFLLILAALLWIRYWYLSTNCSLCLGLIELGILFFLIPVDGTNELEAIEKKVYRRRGRIIIIFDFFIFIATKDWSDGIFLKTLVAMYSVVAFLVLSGIVKKYIFSKTHFNA